MPSAAEVAVKISNISSEMLALKANRLLLSSSTYKTLIFSSDYSFRGIFLECVFIGIVLNKVNINSEPSPCFEFTSILPSCSCIILKTIASPRPVPPLLLW